MNSEEIKYLFDFCSALKSSTTKSKKEHVLKEYRTEKTDCLLRFLLDPQLVTGISNAKINKNIATCISVNEDANVSITEIFEFLENHNTGRDYDIFVVRKFIDNNPEYSDFLKRVFTKNLPLGIEAKTVNKIYGEDLIPVWEVQQGMSIDKYNLKPGEWFSLSQKLNGNRGTFFNGSIISRQGQVFSGLQHIVDDLLCLPSHLVFDGEIIRKNNDNLSDEENFRIGTGILNSDLEQKSDLEFVVFDAVPEDQFVTDSCEEPYSVRKERLLELKDSIEKNSLKNIKIVDIVYSGSDVSQISKWLEYAVKHDWEGLMLNRDVPYYRRRHNGDLKIKRFYTMDLVVLDIEEGQNRLAGTLGAIVCKYKNSVVRVGSGFSDTDRRAVWENKKGYVGRIAEIKYKTITKDKKTGLESLQFPVFVRWRDDKDIESYD